MSVVSLLRQYLIYIYWNASDNIMKYLLITFLLLQGCDASNIITAEQWKEAEEICSQSLGVSIIDRNFGGQKAQIMCKNGSVFHDKLLSNTRYF